MAEALNGTVKTVLIHLLGPWRTCHQLEVGIIEWIDWYNRQRLDSEIGTSLRQNAKPFSTFKTNSPKMQEIIKPTCTKTESGWFITTNELGPLVYQV